MAQYPDKKIPLQGIDMDSDELRLAQNRAAFIKNLTFSVNRNPESPAGEGNNFGANTPLESNQQILSFPMPNGVSQCIGSFESKETNEVYFFIWNSLKNHFIYRINGNGNSQIVYAGSCLNFQNSPEYYISEGRCVLRLINLKKDDGGGYQKKYLVFTDNYNPQRFISVEDSIKTNYFQVPYFTNISGYDCDPCYLINLGIAPSLKCIGITPVAQTEADENLPNLMNNKGWQWRIRYIDHFQRQSEPGIISDRYFVSIGQNCIQTNPKMPRCVDLSIDAGCAFVEKIEIWFRNCVQNNPVGSNDTDWYLYDTIDKYDNCSSNIWYERSINSQYDFDAGKNEFTYRFCGDKECQPIDATTASRTENPLPIASSGLFSVGQGIGLANNVRGFEPLDCKALDFVSYSATDPASGCDTQKLRKIIIYVPIYNPYKMLCAGLWQYDIDNPTIFYGWGMPNNNPSVFGQYFVPGNYGFIGYLAGTQFTAMSTQVYVDISTGQESYYGIPKKPTSVNQGPLYPLPAANGSFLYQKFEFEVPPGKYSFRIANPLVLLSEGYQTTSTSVWGQCTMDNCVSIVSKLKELIIDCCSNDVILNQPGDTTLVIYDLSFGANVMGYVRQDSQTKVPIEWAPVKDSTLGSMIFTEFTDHNGFFIGATTALAAALYTQVDVCGVNPLNMNVQAIGNYTNVILDCFNAGEFPIAAQRIIEGDVKTCNNSIGIAGALVVARGAQTTTTDSTGHFKIILHQRIGTEPIDTFILSQSGGCTIVDCDAECNRCFSDKTVNYVPCGSSDRNTILSSWVANILGNVMGPENGGKYGLGFVMHDELGRHSFVQANENHYVQLKDITDTHSFAFSEITFTINNTIIFPAWVKFITFVATKNLTHEDYLTWVADSVQFIDSAGNINTSAPVKIRIFYESLNEYNKQAGFATNTTWQFLVNSNDGGVQVSRSGDRVQFVLNGDGNWFSKNISAQITYDQEGRYFDLEYTNDLKDLKAGALIKLIRPKDCLTQNLYYETCSTVRIINGKPEVFSGNINVIDSYFLNRQIPIVQEQTDSSGKVVRTVISTYFSFFFEHPSPSDYWGDHCANRGRIFVKNPFEKQKQYGSQIARSKALLNNSNFNGLSYFADEDVKDFAEQEWGNIVVALMEVNTVLVICEHNNFIVGFNDNIPTANALGQIIVNSTPNEFGNPQRKIGSDYGCQPKDINTIRRLQGKVIYLDRNKYSLVQHNFLEAVDISAGGYKGWLNAKIRHANDRSHPRTFNVLFIGGINPKNNEYLFTAFHQSAFSDQPSLQYINDTAGVTIDQPEALIIDYTTGMSKSFAAFTPEYYGTLSGYKDSRAMLAVQYGNAWIHSSGTYNKFFGVQCKKTIQLVTNLSPEKVKRFLYAEVYCPQHKFIAQAVLTESGQQSRISGTYWAFRGKFWSAPFLCDLNTYADSNQPILAIAPLTDGNMLYGRWIKVTYVSEDADDAKYCELDGVVTYLTPYEKSAD